MWVRACACAGPYAPAGAGPVAQVCLKRYYLVHAVQSGRHERVLDFFETLGQDLQAQAEWKDWFILPFLKVPIRRCW